MTARRGTTNRNRRGSSEDRRRRREWLVQTYRADVTLVSCLIPETSLARARGQHVTESTRHPAGLVALWTEWGYLDIALTPVCRCYRCGDLLTTETVTVDRIVPGCRGGTYRRSNIRPACSGCNSETGGATRR